MTSFSAGVESKRTQPYMSCEGRSTEDRKIVGDLVAAGVTALAGASSAGAVGVAGLAIGGAAVGVDGSGRLSDHDDG